MDKLTTQIINRFNTELKNIFKKLLPNPLVGFILILSLIEKTGFTKNIHRII